MKKSIRVFLTYFTLMLSDGLLTLYNTPDLSLEANPLITKLHLGWGALITVNIVFLVIIFICCRYAFEKYQTVAAEANGLKEYISQIFYGCPDKFIWTWYKFPKNWKPFWGCLCYILPYSLSCGAVIRIFEWLMVTFGIYIAPYQKLRTFLFGRLDIAVGLLIMLPLIYVWFRNEYKKSQLILNENGGM